MNNIVKLEPAGPEPMVGALLYKLQTALLEFVDQNDISYASVIGILEILKLDAYREMAEQDDD